MNELFVVLIKFDKYRHRRDMPVSCGHNGVNYC